MIPMSLLSNNADAIVRSFFSLDMSTVRKLFDLGIRPNVQIKVIVSKNNDLVVRVGGTKFAIESEFGKRIIVDQI